ncbi:hypothetical protein GCM10027416_05890 [Okibacterium endophyticum]
MYSDLDRARDQLTYEAVARPEQKLWTPTQAANRIETNVALNKWALTDESGWPSEADHRDAQRCSRARSGAYDTGGVTVRLIQTPGKLGVHLG